MDKIKILSILTLLMVWSTSAFAGGQYTTWGKVIQLTNNKHGLVKIIISSPEINPAKCVNSGTYTLKVSDDNTKVMYSTILNAFSTQQNLRLFILDDACEANFPSIHAIQLKF